MEEPFVTVGALHALAYCERLFYLEEIEHLRRADAAVFAGRTLHAELSSEVEEGTWEKPVLESERLGLRGSPDLLRRRDGSLIPYEHKRGRSAGTKGAREAWRTDRIQVAAYALLAEESFGQGIAEGRVRYHADGVTVRVPVDPELRRAVLDSISRARQLRESVERPPVSANERLCVRCSLAPVCLPEETRLAHDADFRPIRLLPPHPDGKIIHVLESGATIGRSEERLVCRSRDGTETAFPIAEVETLVLHGLPQVTTQALRLCAEHEIQVFWMTFGGSVVGAFAPNASSGQRHLRQFEALRQPGLALELARRLVSAKVESQLRFLLRATRETERSEAVKAAAHAIRQSLRRVHHAAAADELLGLEGTAAAAYFSALPELLSRHVDPRLRFSGRSRRPPADRFNALLSYGYGMLYRQGLASVLAVGLHPGVGFYHRPRSSAYPLALDLMELFRVPLVDMAVVAAVNRRTFDPVSDFDEAPGRVLLSESGRKKTLEVFERRLRDEWRHSVVGYSLSYARMVELEVRLLEKEWMGEGGLFARFRIR